MVLDAERSLSRRALVAGTLGALGGALASALARPLPVAALAQQAVYINNENLNTVVVGSSIHQAGFPQSGRGTGVRGDSDQGIGVLGASTSYQGVQGTSQDGEAVAGYSTWGTGVLGVGQVTGVQGASNATGVHGGGKIGIEGESSTSYFWGAGGYNQAAHGYGVWGEANHATGVGVAGYSTGGRGGVFQGGRAQLRLLPSDIARPRSGAKGDLFVDAAANLWFCKGGTTWVKLA